MSATVRNERRGYRGRLLTPVTGSDELRYVADGLLVVEGRTITYAGAFAEHPAPGVVRDLGSNVLFPGLVDTHVHFPQTRVIGSATGPLLDWLTGTVFPEEARFREESYARAVAREMMHRFLEKGTTTAAIFSSSSESATGALFEALDRTGLRAIAGLTLMDEECPAALSVPRGEALAAAARLADRWHGHDDGRLGFAVTPRFALSCSRALMEDAARFAGDRRLLVQTHVAENLAEGEAVLAKYPFAKDYLGVYDAVGLLGPRTLLAHAIHFSASEWDLCAERGASVAHCPDSNFFLGSGRMRLSEALRRGVRVGLGSDVAAGRSFDLRRAVAHAYDTALCLGEPQKPEALLTLATLGGARALGLDAVTGSLEVGKEADFIALSLPTYADTKDAVVAQLAFADTGKVERVFVRGRQLEG